MTQLHGLWEFLRSRAGSAPPGRTATGTVRMHMSERPDPPEGPDCYFVVKIGRTRQRYAVHTDRYGHLVRAAGPLGKDERGSPESLRARLDGMGKEAAETARALQAGTRYRATFHPGTGQRYGAEFDSQGHMVRAVGPLSWQDPVLDEAWYKAQLDAAGEYAFIAAGRLESYGDLI